MACSKRHINRPGYGLCYVGISVPVMGGVLVNSEFEPRFGVQRYNTQLIVHTHTYVTVADALMRFG